MDVGIKFENDIICSSKFTTNVNLKPKRKEEKMIESYDTKFNQRVCWVCVS